MVYAVCVFWGVFCGDFRKSECDGQEMESESAIIVLAVCL